MHSLRHASAAVLLPILAIRAQTTITLPLFNVVPQSLIGSIVSADATATAVQISCATGVSPADCGFPSDAPAIITAGPSTYHAGFTTVFQDDGTQTSTTQSVDFDCAISASTNAVCTATLDAGLGGLQLITTATMGPEDLAYMAVVVTAGQEKLAVAVATAGAPAASTGGQSTDDVSSGGADSQASSAPSAPASSSGSVSATSGTGAQPSAGSFESSASASSVSADAYSTATTAVTYTAGGTTAKASGGIASGASATISATFVLATANAASGNVAKAGGAVLGVAGAILAML